MSEITAIRDAIRQDPHVHGRTRPAAPHVYPPPAPGGAKERVEALRVALVRSIESRCRGIDIAPPFVKAELKRRLFAARPPPDAAAVAAASRVGPTGRNERFPASAVVDGAAPVARAQFLKAMQALNFVGCRDDVYGLFDVCDEDGAGEVTYDELADRLVTPGSGAALPGGGAGASIVDRVRQAVLAAGGRNGVLALRYLLRKMDYNGDGVVDAGELTDGLTKLGVSDISEDQLGTLMRALDPDNDGTITHDEFVRGISGVMSGRRKRGVRAKYAEVLAAAAAKAAEGAPVGGEPLAAVPAPLLVALFRPESHVSVAAGEMTPEQAIDQLLTSMGAAYDDDGGGVAFSSFLGYYRDVSAGVDADDDFELLLASHWAVGDSGAAAGPASLVTVRVAFHSERWGERVHTLPSDIASDAPKAKRFLEAQGIQDILKVDLVRDKHRVVHGTSAYIGDDDLALSKRRADFLATQVPPQNPRLSAAGHKFASAAPPAGGGGGAEAPSEATFSRPALRPAGGGRSRGY